MTFPNEEKRVSAAKSGKKAVNLSISADLLQAARSNEINLSATLEAAVADQLRLVRRRQWLKENHEAIHAYNRDVEAHGTFSDGLRTF
jgi:antitoxin CcdA